MQVIFLFLFLTILMFIGCCVQLIKTIVAFDSLLKLQTTIFFLFLTYLFRSIQSSSQRISSQALLVSFAPCSLSNHPWYTYVSVFYTYPLILLISQINLIAKKIFHSIGCHYFIIDRAFAKSYFFFYCQSKSC